MKVLADTSVWIDHLHRKNPLLEELLLAGEICTHPVVIGELACGSMKQREKFLEALLDLPRIEEVSFETALAFIESEHIPGRGLGWSDVQLAASAKKAGARLWTKDRALEKVGNEVGLAMNPLEVD